MLNITFLSELNFIIIPKNYENIFDSSISAFLPAKSCDFPLQLENIAWVKNL